MIKEIKLIEKNNGDKEITIKKLTEENEVLAEKLDIIEEKNKELNTAIQIKEKNEEERASLSEELESFNTILSTKTFNCKDCDQILESKSNLKRHMLTEHESKARSMLNNRLNKMKNQIMEQRLEITEQLIELNEREFLEKQNCRCRGKCIIDHFNYK